MTLDKLDAEIIIVSDIHLGSLDDQRGKLLMKLLEHLSQGVQYFIFNGDIFDFCFGNGVFFKNKFSELGVLLGKLSDQGVTVLFLEGNHEFAMSEIGWKSVQFITEKSYFIETSDGRTVALSHGDLLKHDPWYQRFRKLLKSSRTHSLAGMIPGRWLDVYALSHAKISRAQDQYRELDHRVIINAAFEWLGESESQIGIFGHFHVPYCEELKTEKGRKQIYCVESWDTPNVLVYRGGEFYRAYLHEWVKTKTWRYVEPHSIFKHMP